MELFNDTAKEILFEIAEHTGSGAFSTFKISGYPANFLNAGQCVFAIDSTAGATWMGSDAPLVDIAKEALESGRSVMDLVLEKQLLTREELDELLLPENMIHPFLK